MKKDPSQFDFLEGEILLFDKPYGWTSFDVVNHVRISIRNSMGIPKIKVGHAGTLDPLASGLLILCSGKATKQIDAIQGLDKTYTGTLRLGSTTPSYDLETEIDKEYPWEHLDEREIEAIASSFVGLQAQIPPVYSAVHVDGKRAYKMARKQTIDVVMIPRQVMIYTFSLLKIDLPYVDFNVSVSKGTYIRSLVHDFGQRAGSGAHLTALRRVSSGNYHVSDAIDPLVFRQMLENSSRV